VNGRLKDEYGGRVVRVKGAAKVMCHLMFFGFICSWILFFSFFLNLGHTYPVL
jgi:hypothetical protein